jgi:carbamoyl-phosphate synthase large subunit
MITVLISSAGATNGVNVIKALRQSDLSLRLIAVDCDPLASGLFLADESFVIPRNDDPDFAPTMIQICKEQKVEIALPIFSADFPAYRKLQAFLEESSIKTYSIPESTLAICWNKLKTIEHLEAIGIPCPETFCWDDDPPPGAFPLFKKRIEGTGTKDVRIIRSQEEFICHSEPGFIFQRYLDGEEFTIDMISDLHGRVLIASPRKRLKVYGGLSTCGVTIADQDIEDSSRHIADSLGLVGPSNVQCKRKNGELYFYDINPRFASGGLPLAVAAGVNMPEILIRLIAGLTLPAQQKPKAGVYMVRYWESIICEKPHETIN